MLQRFAPQVTTIWINANQNIKVYQQSGVPTIADTLSDFPGPLASMLAALQQAESEWVAFCSCDTPCGPSNLVSELWKNRRQALAVLERGERKLMLFLQQIDGTAYYLPKRRPHFAISISRKIFYSVRKVDFVLIRA
nr:NTP transferase domain-containing protein [Candidatus Erwinia dacicola]